VDGPGPIWMIREMLSDMAGSTVQGLIGITAVFIFLFTIIGVATYRIREQLKHESSGEKSSSHAHLIDQESVNRFGEEPGGVEPCAEEPEAASGSKKQKEEEKQESMFVRDPGVDVT
jgi:hypothetical protein